MTLDQVGALAAAWRTIVEAVFAALALTDIIVFVLEADRFEHRKRVRRWLSGLSVVVLVLLCASEWVRDHYDDAKEEIEKARLDMIQSLEVRVRVESPTDPRLVPPTGDVGTATGLRSAMGMGAGDTKLIKLVTDYQFKDGQIAPTTRLLAFVYKPDDPEQILGHPISDLCAVDRLVFNYGAPQFLGAPAAGVSPNALVTVDVTVMVNGESHQLPRRAAPLSTMLGAIDVVTKIGTMCTTPTGWN
jgi:hypothetical protein